MKGTTLVALLVGIAVLGLVAYAQPQDPAKAPSKQGPAVTQATGNTVAPAAKQEASVKAKPKAKKSEKKATAPRKAKTSKKMKSHGKKMEASKVNKQEAPAKPAQTEKNPQ